MAANTIEVTPTVLKWARERAGLSVEDLLPKFKKIEAWEAGESFPTYPQLEQLSEKLKIPIAVFFFPEPPDVPPISASFRTLPDSYFAQVPARIIYLLRKAKAMQLNLSELSEGRNPAERIFTKDLRFRSTASIPRIVEDIRKYLGVSIDQQSSWPDDDAALKNWRQRLVDVGVFVFKDAFRCKGYSGFCLYDDEFPVIFLNNSMPKTRQIFTLFHELGHLAFGTSGIDALDDRFQERYLDSLSTSSRRIEVACNEFATQVLLPDAILDAAVAGKSATKQTAETLARRYHVSRAVIFLRFLRRNLIDDETYDSATREWASQSGGASGGDYYNSQISYLGPNYINLALRQFYQNRITEVQLAEYLNIPHKNLNSFEERFAGLNA